MPVKTKRVKKGKIRSDSAKVTICIPLEVYVSLKKFADDEIRTVSQQARYFMEIGMEIISKQQESFEMESQGQGESEERQPAIGFVVERDEEDYEDD